MSLGMCRDWGAKIKALYDLLKITSVEELKEACLGDKVAGLKAIR